MLTKRIIVCLDVKDKKVTKGVEFLNNQILGDPIKMGKQYYEQGVDELIFYDITASAENRPIDIEMVKDVAKNIFIPFSVGGGLRHLDDMRETLLAGAEKVSLNSLAVKDPTIIEKGAQNFGSQCIVLSVDAKKTTISGKTPSGFEVFIQGGRKATGIDVVQWIKKATDLGAGEICLNAINTDGVQKGYALDLTELICQTTEVPVIASGGAGKPEHLLNLFQKTQASAGLIASIVHYQHYSIKQIKDFLLNQKIPIRKT